MTMASKNAEWFLFFALTGGFSGFTFLHHQDTLVAHFWPGLLAFNGLSSALCLAMAVSHLISWVRHRPKVNGGGE